MHLEGLGCLFPAQGSGEEYTTGKRRSEAEYMQSERPEGLQAVG
jgi:hypothetical protein